MTPLALLAAAMMACGMALVLSWSAARRPSLDSRLAPYVRPADGSAWTAHGAGPRLAIARLGAALVRDAGRMLERWGSSALDVRARLERSGSALTVEQFRAQQPITVRVISGKAEHRPAHRVGHPYARARTETPRSPTARLPKHTRRLCIAEITELSARPLIERPVTVQTIRKSGSLDLKGR